MSDLGSDLRKNSVVILDDGVVQGAVNRIDFTGGTVSVSGVTATVPLGGSGGTITVQEEGVTQSTTVNTLNFTGAGVTASGGGSVATIDVPAGGGVPASRLVDTVAPLAGGGDLSVDRTLTTSMATNRLIGRGTAGTGVMEEITLGTNLSLTGTTLNATGGGGGFSTTAVTVNVASPTLEAEVVVVDAAITPSSKISVFPGMTTVADANDWSMLSITYRPVAGTGDFTLMLAANDASFLFGDYKFQYGVG